MSISLSIFLSLSIYMHITHICIYTYIHTELYDTLHLNKTCDKCDIRYGIPCDIM